MPPRRRQSDSSNLPRRCRAAAAVAGVIAACAVVAPGDDSRAADPCTISWDGGAATKRWQDDTNWDHDRQPADGDTVCIGAGSEVEFGGLRTTIAAVRVDGSLKLLSNDLRIAGPGESEITGSFAVAGARLQLDGHLTATHYSHSSGIVFGTGAITTPDFVWTGGSEHGSGLTEIVPGGPGLAMSGDNHTLDQTRTLKIDAGAAATWTAGDFELNDHAVLDNLGTLEIRGDQDFVGCCGTAPQVINEAGATLSKAEGAGATKLTYPMANDGTIDVRTGTLSVEGGSIPGRSSFGAFEIQDGATLLFPSGPNALGPSSSIVAHGSGQLRLTGGQSFFTGTVAAPVTIDGPAAYAFFDSPVTLPVLHLARGFLAGSATVSTRDFQWTGGNQIGSGTTRIVPDGDGLAISGEEPHTIEDRHLEIARAARASFAEGTVTMYGAATIENAGLFNLEGDVHLSGPCCPAEPPIHNAPAATFRKSSGEGRATIGAGFRNEGTIDALVGTLDLAGGLGSYSDGLLGEGRYVVRGTLAFPGAHVIRNAAAIELDGQGARIEDSSGADALRDLASNEATGELTLAEGRSLAPGGVLANAGTVTLRSGATLSPAGAYGQSGGVTTFADPDVALRPGGRAELTGGQLTGTGTVDGSLVNGALVDPGLAPGVLTVTGDYSQTPAGALAVQVADPATHTRVDVGGTAHLAGTLDIQTLAPYEPTPADELELIRQPAGEDGEFDTVQGLEPVPGRSYSPPDYAPDAVWLRPGTVPTASIGDAAVAEGDADGAVATFRVSVSPTPTRMVRIAWRTVDGTASSRTDYEASSGTVTVPHGAATADIQVPVHGDRAHERDETFTVQLSSPSNATLARDGGTATILDDDPAPPKEPPGKPPSKPPSKPPAGRPPHHGPGTRPPRPRRCVDRLAPVSRVNPGRRGVRTTRRRLQIRGTARDRGCAGLARVSIAVALHTHHRCRFLKRNGRLGRRLRCRRIQWLRARGTSRWRLLPSRRLPRGRYTIRTRARDRAGNAERLRVNRVRAFRLR
jgi:Calx-beta domain-containing protein